MAAEKRILKKYLEDIKDDLAELFLDNIAWDFAFNTQDKDHVSSITAKQKITTIKDLIEMKAKATITVLGVDTSKNFVERILNSLPKYERKDSLIIELANAISRELQRIELKKEEFISSLSFSTATATGIKELEKMYGVNPEYGLGVKIRQNILIAREITKYETFNVPYLLKICKLFEVGEIVEILNDKARKIFTIILKENIGNIATMKVFKSHLDEFSPAFYEIRVQNEEVSA